MKLVVSGVLDREALGAISEISRPEAMSELHAKAVRFSHVEHEPDRRARVARICTGARLDHAYLADNLTFDAFQLLTMDMDSTVIDIECIDELADLVGKGDEVAEITAATMRGEVTDFADSLRRRVALLAGAPTEVLERVYAERLHIDDGAAWLVDRARSAGLSTQILSGGFDFFADRVKDQLGIERAVANRLEVSGATLTGRVTGDIVDGARKAAEVARAALELGISKSQVIAIGDGANDIPMMIGAGLSVAYHAKEVVRKFADQSIQFGNLSTVVDWLT